MRRFSTLLAVLVVTPLAFYVSVSYAPTMSMQAQAPPAQPPGPPPIDNSGAQRLPFQVVQDYLKYPATMNLGEVLGVAVNSKGELAVLNHPGSGTSGPLYGNATTQVFLFDRSGRFVKEIGQGVYGFGYAHGIRYDRYDNLWVVDKGTDSIMKFNPSGYVTMNLGRRPEGADDPQDFFFRPGRGNPNAPPQVASDGVYGGPTDIAFDSDDNLYISDGYKNSRIAKVDKNGDWVTSWGSRGGGGPRANQNPGQLNLPHNIASDRQNNIYVADRGNRRIQVFDSQGRFLRFLHLNAPYNKNHHPVLGNLPADPASRADETQPWALCITPNGPTQYLFAVDQEPGRLYKMTLDGRILGHWGQSGHEAEELNWPHGIACPTENEVYVADMNNWRVTKLVMNPGRATSSR